MLGANSQCMANIDMRYGVSVYYVKSDNYYNIIHIDSLDFSLASGVFIHITSAAEASVRIGAMLYLRSGGTSTNWGYVIPPQRRHQYELGLCYTSAAEASVRIGAMLYLRSGGISTNWGYVIPPQRRHQYELGLCYTSAAEA